MIRMVKESSLLVKICFCIIAFVLLAVLFADVLMPFDPDTTDLLNKNLPPVFMGGAKSHLLGTDELGRDLLSRMISGTRVSIGMAFFGLLFGSMIGVVLGLTAGYFGGWWEKAVMMLVNFQQSIPFTLIVLIGVVILGRGILVLMLFIGMAKWETYAKMIRGIVLSLKKKQYVEAATCYNASPFRIIVKYIFPGVCTSLIVLLTLNFPSVLLIESSLSFIGIGVQPPTATLGQMVGTGRNYLLVAPWISVAPALVIVVVAYCIQHIGERLRDGFDVRLLEE